jgi:hypothetical protein
MITAGMIGNVLEWYDFALYGTFAAAIGRSSSRTRMASPNYSPPLGCLRSDIWCGQSAVQ